MHFRHRRPQLAHQQEKGAILIVLTLLILGLGSCSKAGEKPDGLWRTAVISKGTIEESVTSTGSLRAVGTISVLAQVTGTLDEVLVDFNDTVHRGQVLARINTDRLAISLKEAQASLERARAQHEYNELQYRQNQRLREQNLISESELAEKRLSWLSSRASLIQAEASEETARINIEQYATILSPVDGIVLDRAVQAGQTVVGSGTSNTQLFTLAEGLEAMEIEVKVDELDISRIQLGQEVRFTVEAWSGRNYKGTVAQIRKLPTVSSSVVSYTVIVQAKNSDGSLLPGMTATADFIVTRREDVLTIPSSALRFTPPEDIANAARRRAFLQRLETSGMNDEDKKEALARYDQEAAASQNTGSRTAGNSRSTAASGSAAGAPNNILGGGAMPRIPGMAPGSIRQAGSGSTTRSRETAGSPSASRRSIWILEDDDSVTMHMIRTGANDLTSTEVLDADELLGKRVITRAQAQ